MLSTVSVSGLDAFVSADDCIRVQIPRRLAGMRLDRALALSFPEYSRTRLQSWIRQGAVSLNGRVPRLREAVKTGDQVRIVALPASVVETGEAWPVPLDIHYQDAAILVVNKPAGIVMHPGAGRPGHTLMNALLAHDPQLAALPRAGIVHRLDKDTSGLLVVARTAQAHTGLSAAIRARQVGRVYEAVVCGKLVSSGTISQPVGRHPIHRTRMAVTRRGRPARSHYRLIRRYPGYSHVRIQLETGRTHQIRVHMAALGHPVAGDPCYGGRGGVSHGPTAALRRRVREVIARQALHACRLELQHPLDQRPMRWDSPLPEDMQALLALLDSLPDAG